MAERGAQAAMVGQETQEAMAGQGTEEAMAERGAWEAMAGSPPQKFSWGNSPTGALESWTEPAGDRDYFHYTLEMDFNFESKC